MNTRTNYGILSNSKIFAKLIAFLKMFVEYTNDYFGGQKYKCYSKIEEKQK